MEMLTSDKMKGRGYLFKGHLKASEFVKSQFKSAGLKPVSGNWYQNFSISQNLFPKEPRLRINNRELKAGIDFLPSAESVPFKQKVRIQIKDSLKKEDHPARLDGMDQTKAIVIGSKEKLPPYKQGNNDVYIHLQDKLTHTLAESQSLPLVIEFKKSVLQPGDSVLDIDFQPQIRKDIATRNVVAMAEGTQITDSFLVVCAHYDHLGALGKNVYFPGANDNASGTSMLMEMAFEIAKRPLKYSVLFIAFSGEEAGLLGSFYFTDHPLVPLSRIKFVMNLDLMGYGDQGATVVNGSVHPILFDKLKAINSAKGYLPELKVRGKAANSDHYPFSERGVPAFFLYSLGGPGFYHDVYDRPETVTLSKFSAMYKLILEFLGTF